jgi:hypothetical protein
MKVQENFRCMIYVNAYGEKVCTGGGGGGTGGGIV